MENIIEYWKNLANSKTNTARDHITYCILRAMNSKSEDKVAVAKHLLHKAFTPIKKASRLANGAEPYQALFSHINNARLYKKEVFGVELSDEEFKEYNRIYSEITDSSVSMIRYYSYFFTRQDISPEQQLVQTAHAALELGNKLQPEQVKNLHFTCIGVANDHLLEIMEQRLTNLGHKFITFREPDIGNERTAIAVFPIAENKRGELRELPLLRFLQREEIVVEKQPIMLIKENK